ncbi:TrkH family potassium uptake protein [Mesobacterium pallidum]|uniref:TrkH family potassium uptake protein n=1 Tax=Mesobacterium pallidum TaxID=2872037 RepID=UPI001EE3957A|nr:TrkH family potassium uptake protein [Mesobacterium pallidum]
MSAVIFVNGLTIVLFGGLMVLCNLLYHDTGGAFLEAGLCALAMGGALLIVSAGRLSRLKRLHTFLLTASVWMTAGTVSALPLWLWRMSPADAFFEAMSGLTTTGATVLSGLDTLPRSVLLWRAMIQSLGGIGFIVTGIALLPFLKVGGMQLFRTESSDKGENELGSAARFASASVGVYVALILLCTLLYGLGGMSDFDALTHALTTMASGGYANYDASFGHFDSAYLQWVCTLFMLCAGLPFAWYIKVLRGKRQASEQVRMMLLTLGAVILGLTLWRVETAHTPIFETLRIVAFSVVSVVTTTGFAVEDYTAWGPFAVTAFLVLTLVGGCTGSTAGGVKAMRWIVSWRAVRVRLATMVRPHAIHPLRYEGRRIAPEVLDGVIGFFTLFALTFGVISVVLTLLGVDTLTAMSGTLTALCNVGPGVGAIIGPAGSFAPLDGVSKVILALAMYLGRLEMLTVFVVCLPRFWQEV